MTTSASMNRKRPAPGSNAPIQIASASQPPSHGGMSAATSSAFLIPPSTSAALNGGNLSATSGQYGHHIGGLTGSPTSAVDAQDIFNLASVNRMTASTNESSQALNMALNNNQVARITNRNSSLMRLPQNQNAFYSQGSSSSNLGVESSHHSQMTGVNNGSALSTGANGGGSGGQGGNSASHGGMSGGVGLDMYGDLAPLIRKAKGKKPNIPPFVQKLSQFVNDPKCDHLIRWSPSGNSFLVLDEDEFSKTLIPDLFKHNNYASFVRQLNMYGFHKVVGLADGSLKTSEQRSKPPSEYKNQYFIRGMPDLMWLIQKPKNTTKRKQGRKKGKTEDSDDDGASDTEVNVSGISTEDVHPLSGNGGGGGGGGGYIEAPPSQHIHHSKNNTDMGPMMHQIEQIKHNQAVISNAISRLRKDNNHLYEQSVAFQTLHDRHETSISAILTFLATVYDKSLIGQFSSQTLANLFQGAVDTSQNGGQVLGNQNNPNMARSGVIGTAAGQPRTPFKRRMLQLPPVPQQSSSSQGEGMKIQGGSSQGQQSQQQPHQTSQGGFTTYQSPSIQEVFTPASGPLSPGSQPQSPTLSHSQLNSGFYSQNPFAHILGHNDQQQQQHMGGSGSNQGQLTPRILRRAITPFLPTAEQNQAIHQHQSKIIDTRAVLDQVKLMQDQQNDNITRLMEIVGPSSRNSPDSSFSRPLSSSSPSASKNLKGFSSGRLVSAGGGASSSIRPSPSLSSSPLSALKDVSAAAGAAGAAGAAVGPQVITRGANDCSDDPQIANLSVCDGHQTPTSNGNNNNSNSNNNNNNNYIQQTSLDGGGGSVQSDPAVDFADIDQFLQTEWLPDSLDSYTQQHHQQQQQQQQGLHHQGNSSSSSASQQQRGGIVNGGGNGGVDLDAGVVGLDPLFLEDTYGGGGYELSGLGMMGGDGGAASSLLGGGGRDGGQILGHSLPSTTVGSPSSPSGGGYGDVIGLGEGMGVGIGDDGQQQAKKKRRTG
ncbi:hypothetical protein DFH27DRAFT_525455 [Peziza echinospora]|nr:hypothetical protein DFH27DRAFT_525455 [Peziza echinospora]